MEDSYSRSGRRKSPGQQRRKPPPFALDDDVLNGDTLDSSTAWTADTTATGLTSSSGYRRGGPKEARLHRVALLASTKEVDHLYPVKVEGIPRSASHESLIAEFGEFGDIGDVYYPVNYKDRKPKKDFAVIRYNDKEAADRALTANSEGPKSLDGHTLQLSPVSKQKSYFTRGTGYLGIANEPVGERPPTTKPLEQSITLQSCRSRSGYPWGSVRELKSLAPHPPKEVLDLHSIRIENLPLHITADTLEDIFSRYGRVESVVCPKTLIITEMTADPNDGYAFVRYRDKRDLNKAILDVNAGRIVVDGTTLSGTVLNPRYWPTEKTRRYY